ncbi:MAG: hypothetical protein OHK0038_09160 [Flammeovirgaceae bacterium]
MSGILQVFAQKTNTVVKPDILKDTAIVEKSMFAKKWYFGGSFNNCWTNIKGDDLTEDHFWKPSLGFTLKAEYISKMGLGANIGFGYQQRGAGIKTEDLVKDLGDPDSTNRLRLRFNTIDFPINILYRTTKDVLGLGNVRGFISAGMVPSWNHYTRRIFISAEDGFHGLENASTNYYNFDILFSLETGLDIQVPNSGVFQVHVVGQWGTQNVFDNKTRFGDDKGKNRLWGLKLGWMF